MPIFVLDSHLRHQNQCFNMGSPIKNTRTLGEEEGQGRCEQKWKGDTVISREWTSFSEKMVLRYEGVFTCDFLIVFILKN